MKGIFSLLLFFLIVNFTLCGQMIPNNLRGLRIPIPVSGMITIKTEQPLLYIGNLETKYNALILDQENLKILEVYTDSTAIKHFGDKGQHGVVVAALINKIPLFGLEEVFDHFNVPVANRTFKVLIDKRIINSEFFLADITKIKRIETFVATQQDIYLSPYYHHTWEVGETYLNIITGD